MLARAVVAPGTERIIEDLFTANGRGDCHCLETGAAQEAAWIEIVTKSLEKGLGTPIGYRYENKVSPAPANGGALVTFEGLFVAGWTPANAEQSTQALFQ